MNGKDGGPARRRWSVVVFGALLGPLIAIGSPIIVTTQLGGKVISHEAAVAVSILLALAGLGITALGWWKRPPR